MVDAGDRARSPEDRLVRLVDRLLAAAERAAAQGAWDHVEEIVQEVLEVAPEDQRAADLLQRARAQRSFPEGERAVVSLLFSDIVRSTDMAETAEPETIRDLFRIYRDVATGAIEALDGTVLQFQGDAVVACFGHPKAHGDDAQRAVLAGLEIVDRMARSGPEIRRRLGVEAPVRVGIHSGVVVAGHASGAGTPDVVGAATNMAARLQAVAEPGTVVISDATRPLVERSFELSPLGKRDLKGIARPVEVFQVASVRPAGAHMETVRLHSPILVGRRDVQDRLWTLWDHVLEAARRGEAAEQPLAVLRGPPGIGKSRIAADLCDRVIAGGATAIRVTCSPYHTNVALWPVARALERVLGLHAEQTPEERMAILRRRAPETGFEGPTAVPLVASLLGLGSAGNSAMAELDPRARRAESLKLLARWIALAAAREPRLVVFDDLQWADPTTVELLGLQIDNPAPGLAFVVSSREAVPEEWAPRAAADIELGPLEGDDARALVTAMAGADLDPDTQRRIARRSGGIPLFVEELARSAAAGRQEQMPLRLQELLAARLRAPGIDLRLAQLAATVGPVFDRVVLGRLAGAPIDRALADLEAAGIVEPLSDLRQRAYQFSHVLLRDAAYETQVLEVRSDRHRRIARMLRAAPDASQGNVAVAAEHLDLAGEVAEAVATYIEAAQEAHGRASHSEARRLLTRALELLDATPEGEARDLAELSVRLLRAKSVSSVLGYSRPEVLEDYQAADDLCRRHRDRPEVMPSAVGVWSAYLARGDHGTSRLVIERVAGLIDTPEGSWFAPEIKSCLGFEELFAGELRTARRVLEQSWEGFMRRPPKARVSWSWGLPNDPVCAAAFALASLAALQGRTAESDVWQRRAIGRAEEMGSPRGLFSLAFLNLFLAWLAMILGDLPAAYRHGSRAMEVAQRAGSDYIVAFSRPFVLIPELGRPSSPELLARAEADIIATETLACRPALLGNMARSHALRGNLVGALEMVEDALLLMQKSGELVHQPHLLRLRAEFTALVDPGRMEDAVADLRAAVEVGLAQDSRVLALGAANDLARLPADARPGDWRTVLQRVHDLLPQDSGSPGLAEARALLEVGSGS